MRAAIESVLILIVTIAVAQADVVVERSVPEIVIADRAQRSKVVVVPFTVAGVEIFGVTATSSCGCIQPVLEKSDFAVGDQGAVTVRRAISPSA